MICLCTEVAFDKKQVGFTPSTLFSRDQQAAVGRLLRMETFLPNTSLLLNVLRNKVITMEKDLIDILTPAKIAHIIEQTNT